MDKIIWSTIVGVTLTIAVLPACDSFFLTDLFTGHRPDDALNPYRINGEPFYHPSNIKPHPDESLPKNTVLDYLAKKSSSDNKKRDELDANTVMSTVKRFLKRIVHVETADDKHVYLNGLNYVVATRKNHPDQSSTALIIIVPQDSKSDKTRPVPPGHAQFRPSRDMLQFSDKSNRLIKKNLRGNEEPGEKKMGYIDMFKDLIYVVTSSKKNFTANGINIIQIDPKLLDKLTRRRSIVGPGEVILGAPTRPEHLPGALPILPGHTLLRPSRGMLKSSVKYPLRDFGGSAVYGNLDNLGITFGKTRSRIRYSDFRKANNDLLNQLMKSIKLNKLNPEVGSHPLIVIEIDPSEIEETKKQVDVQNVNSGEILDDLDTVLGEDRNDAMDLRRKSKNNKSSFRDRSLFYTRARSSEEFRDTSVESSLEKNDGNPFTIFNNKYKQNWPWNHKFDGVHMNINPYAPQFNQLGPTGAELFYARKWWYFNQDDYKPMRRKR